MTTSPALEISGLSYRYPGADTDALAGIDLVVERDERVALLGPNGAGKTTLALACIGLVDGAAGTVRVAGLALTAASVAEIRRGVGVVFQNPDDQLFMGTVRDDVGFGPANHGITGQRREALIASALDSVDGSELIDRVPHHLSGGEKRRVAIATVLAMTPEVLVLDEPTSGLDPRSRRELGELLVAHRSTQLVITHDLAFALQTCPRALIIDGGTIVADGPTVQLLRDRELLAAHRLELPYGMTLG